MCWNQYFDYKNRFPYASIADYRFRYKKSTSYRSALGERQKGVEPSSPAWKAGVMSRYTTAAFIMCPVSQGHMKYSKKPFFGQ